MNRSSGRADEDQLPRDGKTDYGMGEIEGDMAIVMGVVARLRTEIRKLASQQQRRFGDEGRMVHWMIAVNFSRAVVKARVIGVEQACANEEATWSHSQVHSFHGHSGRTTMIELR